MVRTAGPVPDHLRPVPEAETDDIAGWSQLTPRDKDLVKIRLESTSQQAALRTFWGIATDDKTQNTYRYNQLKKWMKSRPGLRVAMELSGSPAAADRQRIKDVLLSDEAAASRIDEDRAWIEAGERARQRLIELSEGDENTTALNATKEILKVTGYLKGGNRKLGPNATPTVEDDEEEEPIKVRRLAATSEEVAS
jgi:hypothetical protein